MVENYLQFVNEIDGCCRNKNDDENDLATNKRINYRILINIIK